MPDIELEPDLILHYADLNPRGNPVILLLHGLGANGDSWFFQFDALANAGYRVLAPDLRGFGRSSCPGNGCSPRLIAQDIEEFLDGLKVPSVALVGISMGGTAALQLAINSPNFVNSLVLVSTFSKLRPDRAYYWLLYAIRYLLAITFGIPTQARFISRKLFPNPDQEYIREAFYNQITQANSRAYREIMWSYTRFNLDDRLNEIKVPTLVVTGERDSVVSPANQSKLAKKIPGAVQVVIKDSDHAVIAEKPGDFNQVLLDFLRQIKKKSAIGSLDI